MLKNGISLSITVSTFLSFFLLMSTFSSPAFADNDEYSVAYWGQTHIHEALTLHHALNPEQFGLLCSHPGKAGSYLKKSSSLVIWRDFYQKKRMAYCKSHPRKTWRLLGQAPYFMLPPREGAQK